MVKASWALQPAALLAHPNLYRAAVAAPTSFCPYLCPGCDHRHLDESASLAQKENFTRQCLVAWKDKIKPITSPRLRTAYRDRVCLNVQEQHKLWRWGMLAKQYFFPLADCPLQTPAINHLLDQTMDILNQARLSQEEFPLRFILINGRQVVWVIKSKPQEAIAAKMLPLLLAQQAQLAVDSDSLWWHWNECCGRRVISKKTWQKIWGPSFGQNAAGLRFGPRCFRQVHPTIYIKALQKAAAYLGTKGASPNMILTDTSTSSVPCLVDLFCGMGTSLSFWSQVGLAEKDILGVELNGEALAFAAENFPQATFLRGTPEQRIPQIISWVGQREVYLFVNPPRLGLTVELRDFICLRLRPSKMVYLSCGPKTLSRDLIDLAHADYIIDEILPFDFFPQTKHVENLVLLRRKAAK